jgi:Domain of unknown function (DUF4864)
LADAELLDMKLFSKPPSKSAPSGQSLVLSKLERTIGMEPRCPVYRHRSFEFGEGQAADDMVVQRVHIVDDNGEAWEALYTLEQQADGSLKIVGCVLLKAGQAV